MAGGCYESLTMRYFRWLDMLVGESVGAPHSVLSKSLRIKFYPLVAMDENRESDGLWMREYFSWHVEGWGDEHPTVRGIDMRMAEIGDSIGGCSVLEMMLGVARRAEGMLYPHELGPNYQTIFWGLMKNLGFSRAISGSPFMQYDDEMVEKRLINLVERRYKYNGEGGLFPLEHPKTDQRRVEIWCQMQNFFVESMVKSEKYKKIGVAKNEKYDDELFLTIKKQWGLPLNGDQIWVFGP